MLNSNKTLDSNISTKKMSENFKVYAAHPTQILIQERLLQLNSIFNHTVSDAPSVYIDSVPRFAFPILPIQPTHPRPQNCPYPPSHKT